MRVACVLGSYPSLSETFVARELEALARRGVDVRILAFQRDPGVPASVGTLPVCYFPSRPVLLFHALFASIMQASQTRSVVDIVFKPVSRHESYGWLRAFTRIGAAVWAARALEDWKPEIVHAHFLHATSDIAAAIAAELEIPHTAFGHAWDLYVPPSAATAARADRCDTVFVCTEHGREALVRFGSIAPERVRLVRHGLGREDLSVDASQGTHIVAVARLVRKKGLDHLVAACRLLRDRGVDFACRIAGDGPERRRLQQQIDAADLGDCVELIGAVSHAEVRELYQRAAVFVSASVVAPNGDRDGVPNAVLEAMANGVPCVVSDASAAPELIQNGVEGLVVSAGSPEALANAIARLLESPELHAAIGSQARERARRDFDVDAKIVPMLAEFERLIGSRA